MLDLSYWRPGRLLFDPMCGSGTIPIEAALIAENAAPGLKRGFVSEDWPQIDKAIWEKARVGATVPGRPPPQAKPLIYANDIDPKLIEQARENAEKAGVADMIEFKLQDIAKAVLPGEYGVLITNPPYGQRLGEREALPKLYSHLKRLIPKNSTWSAYVITSDQDFEKHFGRKADAKRKLFNGATKTDYYQFHGPKPQIE
jgi:putative N6-adenine-specific DNA methylase